MFVKEAPCDEIVCLNKRLSKQSRRRRLRCYRAHHEVTIMEKINKIDANVSKCGKPLHYWLPLTLETHIHSASFQPLKSREISPRHLLWIVSSDRIKFHEHIKFTRWVNVGKYIPHLRTLHVNPCGVDIPEHSGWITLDVKYKISHEFVNWRRVANWDQDKMATI